jgi:hypothetical protein
MNLVTYLEDRVTLVKAKYRRFIDMSEESFNLLSIDNVCAIMIRSIDKYLLLEKLNHNKAQLEEKRAEL